MKPFAERFYKSKRWQSTAKAYAKSVGMLCEPCAMQGVSTPGEIVHHRIELTPENIHDPAVSLGWDNLELVCRECHALRHRKHRRERRYKVDDFGNITACEPPLPAPKGMPWETGAKGGGFSSRTREGGCQEWQKRQRNSESERS